MIRTMTAEEWMEQNIERRQYLLTSSTYAPEILNTADIIEFLESLKDAIHMGTIAPGESFTIKRKSVDDELTAQGYGACDNERMP